MTQDEQQPAAPEEVVNGEDQAPAPEVPLNRAQRRALASGKKGSANNPLLGNQTNTSGMAGRRSMPTGQGRMQTRGSNRGK